MYGINPFDPKKNPGMWWVAQTDIDNSINKPKNPTGTNYYASRNTNYYSGGSIANGNNTGSYQVLLIPEYVITGYLFFHFISKYHFGDFYAQLFLSSAATASVLTLIYFLQAFFYSAIAIAIMTTIGWLIGPLCFGITLSEHTEFTNVIFHFITNSENWHNLLIAYTQSYLWIYLVIPFFGFFIHIEAHSELKKEFKGLLRKKPLSTVFSTILTSFVLVVPFAAYLLS